MTEGGLNTIKSEDSFGKMNGHRSSPLSLSLPKAQLTLKQQQSIKAKKGERACYQIIKTRNKSKMNKNEIRSPDLASEK